MGINHDLGSMVPKQLLASCCIGNSANSKLSSLNLKLYQKPCCQTVVLQISVQIMPIPSDSFVSTGQLQNSGTCLLTCEMLGTYQPSRIVGRRALNKIMQVQHPVPYLAPNTHAIGYCLPLAHTLPYYDVDDPSRV